MSALKILKRSLLLFSSVSSVVAAQAVLWTTSYESALESENFGAIGVVDGTARDFDGDAVPDVLTSVLVIENGGYRGRTVLLSGFDGSVLGERDSVTYGIPSGDLDSDGVPEIWAVHATADGRAYTLWSGDSFFGDVPPPPLTSFTWPGTPAFGREVATGPDATGDGVPDLLGMHAGRVWLYSGAALAAGGTSSARVFAPPPDDLANGATFSPGWDSQMAIVADLDGDGLADVLASHPFFDPPGPDQDLGVVYAFSSATGAVLHRFRAARGVIDELDLGRRGLATIGGAVGPGAGSDLDGDGVPEIVVASTVSSEDETQGVVEIYGGASGERLREIRLADPPPVNSFGRNLRILPDADGDGAADILVSVWLNEPDGQFGPRAVLAYSSQTGHELWRVEDPGGDPRSGFGQGFLAVAGDLDGDGRADLFVGAPRADVDSREGAGLVYAISAPEPVKVSGGTSPSASPLSLSASPNPSRGRVALSFRLPSASGVRLTLHDALGREVAVLADGARAAGPHRVATPAGLAPGVYLARLAAGGAVATRTLAVVR